jgi:hypothetical protein
MAILRHVSWLKSIGMLKVDSPVCLVWLGEVMFEFIENNLKYLPIRSTVGDLCGFETLAYKPFNL